jgi:hypothetical protein
MTMHAATESAPWPPNSSGTCVERFLGEARVLVDVGGVRCDLFLAQRADRGAELLMLLRQLEQVERRISGPTSHHHLLATRR